MADEMMTVGLGLRFEDTPVGMKFKTIGRTVTEADITMFVGVTGMVEVLFTNMEYLAEESLFAGKRLVPGALVYSFAEGLLMQTVVQGVGLSFLGMELNVEGPTFAGDTLHVECEVLESRPTKKVGRGIVKTRNRVINQRGECVMTYTPTRLVKGRDYSPKG
ncbi:MaoC/PaaZ C-terminal domain-containing protein [Phreatobacter oligotrophus]|jgi:acyl dehydratase|uniref:MaoC/PaaZ C-terminal domain-containing protein n=1 Tax=Phreatobacter oligotrophus TaxID=1122261 RepID=UPI0023549A22|nr:MaoC/PaaZ C-terminal domain-containing protein [Phreatobacter oligotrophus]